MLLAQSAQPKSNFKMGAPASHLSLLIVFISLNADILNETLEMQAAPCPQNKKGTNRQTLSLHAHRAQIIQVLRLGFKELQLDY